MITCRQSHGQAQKKSGTLVIGKITYMGHFFLGFLWPIILFYLTLSLYLVFLKVLPCGCIYPLAKMEPREKACGQVDITYNGVVTFPFLTSKEHFCTCIGRKVSLTLRMRKYGLFNFYLGRDQLLLSPAIVFFLEYLSREDKLQLGSLATICLLPQFHVLIYLVFGMRETCVLKLCFFFFSVKGSSNMFYV